MTTINRITVTGAEVSKASTTAFSIDANWDIAKSGGSYVNSYFMQIVMNGNVVKEQEIPNSGGDTDQYGTIQIDSIMQSNMYYLQVTDNTKTVKSIPVLLLFSTYDGVKGSYDGKNLHINWNKPQGLVNSGRCTLTSLEDNSVTQSITANSRHLVFEESLEDYDPNNIWSVFLVPTLSDSVDGPCSNTMNFYTQTVTLQNITSTQNVQQADMVDLMITFQQPYGNPDGLKVQTILWKNGTEFITNTPVVMPQPINNSYTLPMTVSKEVVDPYKMGLYQVGLYLCTDSTITKINRDENYWKLTDTKIFQRGYYPVIVNNVVTGIVYRENSDHETESHFVFQEELFKSSLQQTITSGSLSLATQTSGGYLLTIGTQSALTQTDYNTFFTSLSQNNVKISGLYKIQDAIVRGGNLALIDILYFHCGLDKNKRCADLRPGFTLEVETATYMPIYEIKQEDAAPGFVSTHTAQYTVATRDSGTDILLEFNSFIDNFAENIDVAADENGVKAGGVLDLFVSGYRQPLYKIVYPSNIKDSSEEQKTYQSDNVLLIGASTYNQMQDISNNISTMVSYEDSANAPMLMFRGRSAVSLMITVWINGTQMLVGVGTTLGKILERQAIYNSSTATVAMKRVSPMGYSDVQLLINNNSVQTDLYWRALTLVHGDRIEVR
ncbi:MAG: hypothetical protein P4L69_02745 [Desulfosporosinus sp.]|nr:hypothetical protein [Desulfosporosinus sp.]